MLGDVISADEQYITAIETALKDRLQTILVENEDDALLGAGYLLADERGRAAFLPLSGGAGGTGDFEVPDIEGVVGPAWRFVRTEARFSAVVKRMFSGIVVVESLRQALAAAKTTEGRGLSYVTLTGEMVGSAGDIHAGKTENTEATVIGRAERLKALAADLAAVDRTVRDLEESRDELTNRSMVMRGMVAEMEKTKESIRTKLDEVVSREARIVAKKDAVKDSADTLRAEAERIGESFVRLDTEMARLNSVIGENTTLRDGAEASLGQNRAAMNDARLALEKQRSEMTAIEVERASLIEKKAALTREMTSIAERREALAQASGRSQGEIERAEEEILETGEHKQELGIRLANLEKEHEGLIAGKNEVERRYNELRSKRSDLEKRLQEQRRELDEMNRRESALKLERDETQMRMSNIRERLATEFYIESDEELSIPTDPEFDPANERLLLDDLRRRINNIGDVNLAAEADYEEEKKRLDFLESERGDLVEAGETLKSAITKINGIARSRFVETFERIKSNFKDMYGEFFQGGTCELELEEDADPLEATIKISARPPGKNIRTIGLLSSGERALTAISLLFAIYLVKPSPFCILDEVDAPLDDANIDRFLRVLKRFSARTQFIMVTHNKKTMAAADNLYGITQEEPGLSRLVSVRISDADPGEISASEIEEEAAV